MIVYPAIDILGGKVVHTPGHASNHLCYLLEEEKTLFTGDHVMQASTVVINPPDGDMAAYIASLRDIAGLDLEWLAPGHGFLMAQPREAMEWIVDHRLRREAKQLDLGGGLACAAGLIQIHSHRCACASAAHRLKREAKVVAALAEHGPASAERLLAAVYADVPIHLHAVAMRSLTAHLLKLRDDGAATESAGEWALLRVA